MKRKTVSTVCIVLVCSVLPVLAIPDTGCSVSSGNSTDNSTGYIASSAISEFELPPPPPSPVSPPALPPTPVECSKTGCKAPGFTLESYGGKTVSLVDYKGKNLFLSFWPDGCKECERQLYLIQQAYEQWPREAIEFLVINSGGDKMNVSAMLAGTGFSFTILFDADGEINELYKNGDQPVSYLIDHEGIIDVKKEGLFKNVDEIYKFFGPRPCSEAGNKIGQRAPDFTLRDVSDVPVSLGSLRGKKVILVFLQTACETCRTDMKHVQDALAAKPEKEWAALFIAVRDSREYIRRITILYSITVPVLLDSKGEVNDTLYRPAHLPCTYFLNEYGCICNIKDGYFENARQVLCYMDY